MNRRPFALFKNKILVESGSFTGDGIQQALDDGFEKVLSFEVCTQLYNHCVQRFENEKRVELINGSSATQLLDEILKINEPITFWLDGHYSAGITSYDPNHICPLILELYQISQHPIKTHTILIDDRRLMTASTNNGIDGNFDVSEETVLEKLKQINPNYKISYLDGHVEKDIIIAQI